MEDRANSKGLLRTGSTRHAAELVRLGWTVTHQFFWDNEDEPYEIGLRWDGAGEAVREAADPSAWLTPEGVYRLTSEREMRHRHDTT